jgi:hypothetical protein
MPYFNFIYFNPDYRNTASSLSAIINGLSTILMFVFKDPFLSVMTDDAVLGRTSESLFMRYIVSMVFARVLGTVIAQLMLMPAARVIALAAGII